MASDQGPSSAWNPALMPNSDQESHAAGEGDHAQPTSSATSRPQQTEEIAPQDAESPDDEPQVDEENHAETSFSNDGDAVEGGALLGHGAEQTRIEESVSTVAPGQSDFEQTDAPAPERSATKPQHSSSMSFARTVSHEPNFHDDDEGDWSLPRADTDPFKFMQPSDRTNSFPVVPLLASGSNADQEPLPPTQALDALEETEREADDYPYGAGNVQERSEVLDNSQVLPFTKRPHARSIGGEVPGYEAVADEARYEEGVPLISRSDDAPSGAPAKNPEITFDDDEVNDDFFSQTQNAENEARPHLERKSTMQVLERSMEEDDEDEDEDEDDGSHDEVPEVTGLGIDQGATSHLVANGEAPTSEDLSAKWQEAFASDDEDGFLLEDSTNEKKPVDVAAFWGDDDEGFLEDDDGGAETAQPVQARNSSNSYMPQANHAQLQPSPMAPTGFQGPMYTPPTPSTPFTSAPQYGQPLQQRPDPNRAESFADKAKGGYSSPYDLPTDLVQNTVKPRRRPSLQQLASAPAASMPPPPPSAGKSPNVGVSPGQKPPGPSPAKSGFFEDLPMIPKPPRTTSRQSNRAASPALHAPPPGMSPAGTLTGEPFRPMPSQRTSSLSAPSPADGPPPGISNLVAPDRVSPYASMESSTTSLPISANTSSRYSPAPPASSGAPVSNRYSPAPAAAVRSSHGYGPAAASGGPPAVFPHQPRTSSPLAHFEVNHNKPYITGHSPNGDTSLADRRASSAYETRLNRVPSLPPTREVDEEEEQAPAGGRSLSVSNAVATTNGESRYTPSVPGAAARQTPPPPTSFSGQPGTSPLRKPSANYAPKPASTMPPTSMPPSRADTQSPGTSQPSRPPSDAGRGASSTYSTSPIMTKSVPQHGHSRTRGQSITMQIVPPTDGREHDPLQRWKGVPIITWGVGGTVVTSFPKSVPRYGMNQSVPTIFRTPGEVHIKSIKDIAPLAERLTKFPGPLKGKSKKKETISWLTAGIDTLEKELPEVSFHAQLSPEDKRAVERLLLWKILRIMIEHDGVLEGTPAVEKAVRDVLSPGTVTPTADNDALFPTSMGAQAGPITSMQADGADVVAMEQFRHHLLRGDREAAVWTAADKRLWGHAMLISMTVSTDLYKRVAQEFVRKEVNFPGHSNEPIGALYKVLSGNFDDCVDELVPVHARAGLQLLSTAASLNPSTNNTDGLDKWRETLTLILSNRSPDDIRGLHALGNLLSSYGRPEAAHVCFLFSRHMSLFSGLDDPNTSFVLLGSDHRQQKSSFAKELEAVQLSEVYEYALSLGGGALAAAGAPHLAAYKLQHAMHLAEYGQRDKALQYCDAIATAVTSQTKRSPYHHIVLEAAVDDFMTRLKQAPKGESSSWISKPSMNKVSDSMWNRFNKFVAGDDVDGASKGGAGDDNGPFARVATTPNLSRSPSMVGFEPYGGSPSNSTNMGPSAPSAVSSRYAPITSQQAGSLSPYEPVSQFAAAPRTSSERNSSEMVRSPYEPISASAMSFSGQSITQQSPAVSHFGLQESPALLSPYSVGPTGVQESPALASPYSAGAPGAEAESQGYSPPGYGYSPPHMGGAPVNEDPQANGDDAAGGYEAPSFQPYGYEPPSYEPPSEPVGEEDDVPKPKKKSFMDDDDDDIPALRANDKSKADKDRENEEMFRKAAEEDAKRAAAQKEGKKGWGFGGWFGGSKPKADMGSAGEASPNKPIRAKLGEQSSFIYDPDLKRWVNKKPGAENAEPKKETPPPPRSLSRAGTGTPPPMSGTPPPPMGRASAPPPTMMPGTPPPMPILAPAMNKQPSQDSVGMAPPMARSVSNMSATSAPPSRPTTSMSNASSIDDLLSASTTRKPGQKKARKSGRYVDVMAK